MSSGAAYDVVNPATEEVVTTVPLADVEDTDAAVARARRAFDTWRHVAPASMTNRQADAFCVKLWQHTEPKLRQLHFRVQSCREHLDHFPARRF